MSPKSIEERLENLRPSPSARFDRRMAHAAWTPAGSARRRGLVATGLVLVIAVALLAFTPQGRALAQGILRFFTRAESDTLPVQTWQLAPVTATPTPEAGYEFDQAVAAVEQQAGFDILQPAALPDHLVFAGASYEPDGGIIRIFYRETLGGPDDTNGLVLRQEPFQTRDDCTLCGEVGASAEVRTVQVGAATGEYVVGVWKLTDAGPVWESDPYLQTLRWQANGMAYELLYMGMPDSVTEADLIAIAASLK